MIRTILWDFDGVILDSMKIKANGFIELFKEYDKTFLVKIEKYHYDNGGVSRFDKIRYFYNNILQEDILEAKIIKLADKFAKIIEKEIQDKNNLIDETINYIKKNHLNYNFHIVSGAEHSELNQLCAIFKLNQYFITIDGSPTKKDILVENIIKKYYYKEEETILIGDAMTDYLAAKSNNITFYGFNNKDLKKYNYIDTFKEFNI